MADAVLLAGASGMVGREVLTRLLARPAATAGVVLAPLRRPLERSHPALRAVVADLADPSVDAELGGLLRAALGEARLGSYLCCLGSTIAKAGSRAAFEAVDHGLVLRLARLARRLGARQAIVVSSVGANAGAANFYLAVKGRMEQELATLGFERIDLLRPGLLLGARAETRPLEGLAQRAAPLFNPLLLGTLRRYRAIAAVDVAEAAVALCGGDGEGVAVHEFDDLVATAALARVARGRTNAAGGTG